MDPNYKKPDQDVQQNVQPSIQKQEEKNQQLTEADKQEEITYYHSMVLKETCTCLNQLYIKRPSTQWLQAIRDIDEGLHT